MKMSKLYFVHFVLQFYFISTITCQPNFLDKHCIDDYGNYTQTSTYKSNLNTLFSSMLSDTKNNFGFYNISVGQGQNKVNGIALCRGDVTTENCHICLKNATTKLPQVCPTQKEAIGWYDLCMLRYTNRAIFGVREQRPVFLINNVNNVSNANKFSQALGSLLSSLQVKAALGDSRLKFADGDANYDDFNKVFALVQCTPDLSYRKCFNCIGDFIVMLPSFSASIMGARVIGPSCQVRYVSALFYNLPSSPSPLPDLSTPPLSFNVSSNLGRRSGTAKAAMLITVPLVIIASIALAVGFCLLCKNFFKL